MTYLEAGTVSVDFWFVSRNQPLRRENAALTWKPKRCSRNRLVVSSYSGTKLFCFFSLVLMSTCDVHTNGQNRDILVFSVE